MKSLQPVLSLIVVAWIDFTTWRMHPMSPSTNKAVIRRNHLTVPI